jgi:hypothetical protein
MLCLGCGMCSTKSKLDDMTVYFEWERGVILWSNMNLVLAYRVVISGSGRFASLYWDDSDMARLFQASSSRKGRLSGGIWGVGNNMVLFEVWC